MNKNDQPLYRLRNVTKIYDDGQVHALQGVSLEIQQGEYLAITGPSGSGKSTLLNLLGSLDQPTSGEIAFAGESLRETANVDRFRARTLGFVFQSFHLLPTLTAAENVQIPMFEGTRPRGEWRRRAEELLASVGLAQRMNQLPTKLSVGERQRVAIARALANGPQVLLADEPTGNLDSESGQQVLELFDRLHQQQGLTLIVITHGAEVAARAQRVVTIRDGRLAERTAGLP